MLVVAVLYCFREIYLRFLEAAARRSSSRSPDLAVYMPIIRSQERSRLFGECRTTCLPQVLRHYRTEDRAAVFHEGRRGDDASQRDTSRQNLCRHQLEETSSALHRRSRQRSDYPLVPTLARLTP